MPSTSKSQQRLFSMALAVRKGELKRSDVYKSVLDIVDSDMTDKEIKDFTVLKEHYMKPLKLYITEKRDLPLNKSDLDSSLDLDHKIFIIVKPGFLEYASDIIDMYKKEGFVLYEQRPKQLQLSEARKLYSMHKNEDWYKALCEYMASGVSMGITFIYRGSVKEAFKKCSELKDKIRDKWAEDDKRNVMHSSDNPENMKKESSFYV